MTATEQSVLLTTQQQQYLSLVLLSKTIALGYRSRHGIGNTYSTYRTCKRTLKLIEGATMTYALQLAKKVPIPTQSSCSCARL